MKVKANKMCGPSLLRPSTPLCCPQKKQTSKWKPHPAMKRSSVLVEPNRAAYRVQSQKTQYEHFIQEQAEIHEAAMILTRCLSVE